MRLSTFLLLCLVVMFGIVGLYQQYKIQNLETTVANFEAPYREEIESIKASIASRQVLVDAAIRKITLEREADEMAGNRIVSIKLPVGLRQQLHNLRNAEYQIEREKKRLKNIEREFAKMRDAK